jgi:hypothetical protein
MMLKLPLLGWLGFMRGEGERDRERQSTSDKRAIAIWALESPKLLIQ